MPKAPAGDARVGRSTKVPERNTGRTKSDALADVGLTRKDAHACERIAAIPEPVFEKEVVKPDASTAKLADQRSRTKAWAGATVRACSHLRGSNGHP